MGESEGGRTAVITGGQGDLAAPLRGELAEGGFRVLAPGRAELDVRSRESVTAFFSRVEKLELLVLNAAIVRDQSAQHMEASTFAEVVETNLTGAMRCARAALPLLLRDVSAGQGMGHVVLLGSFSGLGGAVGQTNYAAAKAGLIGLTQSLAAEWGASGLRVNCVLPGFMETKMTAPLSEAVRERARARHVLGRFNEPGRAAKFIRFLHEEMLHTSGQVFNVDSRIHRWA